MTKNNFLLSLCMMAATASHAQTTAPEAIAPLPEPRQVAWQQLETYAFVHFGPNTFNNRESPLPDSIVSNGLARQRPED